MAINVITFAVSIAFSVNFYYICGWYYICCRFYISGDTKVITNQSKMTKITVPKINTNGKSVVQASTGLPAGLLGQQTKTALANFQIPKLYRSTCNSTSKSTANSTTQSHNPSVPYKTSSKLLIAKSSRKPTTYLPKVSQAVSQQSKRNNHTATTNPKRNVRPTTKFESSITATITVTTAKPQDAHVQQR